MLKIVSIGCGQMHQLRCRLLGAIENVVFAAHCDQVLHRAEAACELFGGEAYADTAEMLDSVKPDAAYVAVPPNAHGPIEEELTQRGVPFFLEKPVALDLKTARVVRKLLRNSGAFCAVGHPHRYASAVEIARKSLRHHCVSLVSGVWTGGPPETDWRRRMAHSGGQLVFDASTLIDLIRFLCGEAAEVYATGSTGCMSQIKDYDIFDSTVLLIRLKSGASAAVAASCIAPYEQRLSLDVTTPEAGYSLCDDRLTVRENGKTTHFENGHDMMETEIHAFIEAVRTGKRRLIRSSYSDAMRTLQLALAANESIRSGLPVRV
jgi:predicted dehydrogenase